MTSFASAIAVSMSAYRSPPNVYTVISAPGASVSTGGSTGNVAAGRCLRPLYRAA